MVCSRFRDLALCTYIYTLKSEFTSCQIYKFGNLLHLSKTLFHCMKNKRKISNWTMLGILLDNSYNNN